MDTTFDSHRTYGNSSINVLDGCSIKHSAHRTKHKIRSRTMRVVILRRVRSMPQSINYKCHEWNLVDFLDRAYSCILFHRSESRHETI